MSSEQNFDHAPAVLPVLALRGLVLFPEMVLHFDVGRKKSILALACPDLCGRHKIPL